MAADDFSQLSLGSMGAEDANSSSDSRTDIVVALKAILYVVGFFGNVFVIFVITILKEYKKIAHWYLLQLSIADFMFLNTIPFKIAETVWGSWDFSVSACKAINAILYVNYYASVLFLTVMAIDRFTAVCHPLSSRVQVFRTPAFRYWVSAATWLISLALSVPVILYSNKVGMSPHCTCSLQHFPVDMKPWCKKNLYSESEEDICLDDLNRLEQIGCYTVPDFNYTELTSAFQDMPASYSYGITDEDFNSTTSGNMDDMYNVEPEACAAYDPLRPGFLMFVYFNFAVMFVLPLLVISICYGFIVYRVTKRKDIHADKFSSVHGQHRKVVKESKRVTMVCALLVAFFAVCWLPFHAFHLVKIGGKSDFDEATGVYDRLDTRRRTRTAKQLPSVQDTSPLVYSFD